MTSNVYDLRGKLPSDNEVRDWIFTFGVGQGYAGRYIVINGTFNYARNAMFERHGEHWSMQYRTKEEAGVDRHKLVELK